MNGAQAIIHSLQTQGVSHIFGYPGGCIMPLYDALPGSSLKHILCRHEQAAALAADGYARASGRLGVCVATSGPGATNLITGVANAYMDSVPLLVITGQVATGLIGTDAFQEADILGMTLGVVKHSYLVERVEDLPRIITEATTLATSGRPGPVWVDIPKDVLLAPAGGQAECVISKQAPLPEPASANVLKKAAHMIQAAKKPLLYTGGGVAMAKALNALRAFSAHTAIPQVVTLKGIGNPAADDPLNFGMLGMHGSRAANTAVSECDLLIAVGVRFDDRATGKVTGFAPNAKIIHLDIDAAEFNKNKTVDCVVPGCLPRNLRAITDLLATPADTTAWQNRCKALIAAQGFGKPEPQNAEISGPGFLAQLSSALPEAIISCDVGQHQMWVAQFMRFAHPAQHLSSGGLGTMGFGLPAAIGAALAMPGTPVVNVTGDGSFMMNLQELATITRYRLPIKIVVLNNQCLGMVRQQQELFYERRYSEVDLSDNPDFTHIAKAFGIPAITVQSPEDIPAALKKLQQTEGAMLLNVITEQQANVWPIVKPGAANHEMIDQTAKHSFGNSYC